MKLEIRGLPTCAPSFLNLVLVRIWVQAIEQVLQGEWKLNTSDVVQPKGYCTLAPKLVLQNAAASKCTRAFPLLHPSVTIKISVAEPEPVEQQLSARVGAEVFLPGSGYGYVNSYKMFKKP
jgi:hypothetical protein